MTKKPSKKKHIRSSDRKPRKSRGDLIKALVFLAVAALVAMFYSGGTIRGFIALVIAAVCGLLGVVYLRGVRKR